jgi:signal transduction histidine kinase/DNA-binding response OmpR family regulator
MKKIHLFGLWLLSFWLCCSSVLAQTGVDIGASKIDLARHLWVLEDTTQQLSVQQTLAITQGWQAQPNEKPYFGYSKSAFWLRADLAASSSNSVQSLHKLLEITYPLLDDIQVYVVNNKKVIQHVQLGDNFEFGQRILPHRLFVVPLSFESQQDYQLYIRVTSTSGLQVPVVLWSSLAFAEHDQNRQLLLGCFYGSLIIMIAYNFFIWLSVREKSYLLYVFFVISFGLLLATIDGFTYQYLWPNAVWWNNRAIVVILNITLALSLAFSKNFLRTSKYNPQLNKVLTLYMSLMLLMAVLSFYFPYRVMIVITLLLSAGTAFLVITTGIFNWRAGNRAARFFVYSWMLLAAMVILYVMSQLNVIPKSTFTNLAVQFGEWCEVLLLSFALADRINISRLQEQEAQTLLMAEERRANAEREQHLQTKLKAQEEEIRAKQAINQAQSESRAKSMFLATMSHEIRTPMNGVLGMTELLQATDLSQQQQQFVHVIHNSGNALLNIINDILDYSKIEAGKMDIESIDMDLDNLLLECASIFSLTAEQKRLEFLASIEPNTPVFIQSDPTRLKQILLNLLSNAFKFTHRGRISLRVHTVIQQTDSHLHFEISDTGIGMADEQLSHLFEAFNQADVSTTRQFGGTGLGLSISKRLVDLMQGTMNVSSKLGQGTTFAVAIPFHTATQAYIHDHFVPLTALQGQRILFVDDSIEFTQIMTEQAQAWGMIADAVHDGAHALALMRHAEQQQQSYDIVAVDMRMPNMSGLDLAYQMSQDESLKNIKRILLTAMRAPLDTAELERAGLSLVIQKPTSANSLRDALLKLMGCEEQYRSSNDKRQDITMVQRVLQHKHLLIAEDNAVNQMVIIGMLKRLGITADIANHGKEALALYQQKAQYYHLILMDCEMPEMDGYQTTQNIRAWESQQNLPPVTIVALTAHAMRDQHQRCLNVGMDDFLTKPLAFERLKQMLMQVFWRSI